jgi:hypothetical protein
LLFRCQAIPFQFQEAEEGRSISRIRRGGEAWEGRMPEVIRGTKKKEQHTNSTL